MGGRRTERESEQEEAVPRREMSGAKPADAPDCGGWVVVNERLEEPKTAMICLAQRNMREYLRKNYPEQSIINQNKGRKQKKKNHSQTT